MQNKFFVPWPVVLFILTAEMIPKLGSSAIKCDLGSNKSTADHKHT